MFAENSSWEDRYMQTIQEVNGQKMPERITATRQAISGRLHDLEHDSDHHAEGHQIENALRALSVLEVETQQWAEITPDWNKKLDAALFFASKAPTAIERHVEEKGIAGGR